MALDRTLSVAPMMDCTDRHQRYLMRLISRRTLLYTEMVTANALARSDPDRLLALNAFEHPVALQVGGSEPARMAYAAELAEAYGYDEININVGCPSERVQSGAFGACLMAEPETVAACVERMKNAVAIPVTVKTRIGIDDCDSYAFLQRFTRAVVAAGTDALIVHARKAWLQGLSPKANREIPPLDYARVHRLKQDWPDLPVILNGGLQSLDAVAEQRVHVDGCMLGRAPYRAPYMLADADRRFWGDGAGPSREAVLDGYMPYIEACLAAGGSLQHITRHLSGLFQGCRGARAWRRALAQGAARHSDIDVVEAARAEVAHAPALPAWTAQAYADGARETGWNWPGEPNHRSNASRGV
jgi:tRNA-dihydrouridine synthase A